MGKNTTARKKRNTLFCGTLAHINVAEYKVWKPREFYASQKQLEIPKTIKDESVKKGKG